MEKCVFVLLLVLVACFGLVWFAACGDDDDDDDDNDDSGFPDDDDDDDDTDEPDDDDDDDDTVPVDAPVIADGAWDPETAIDDPDDATTELVSALAWTVCDPDDNLAGGLIHFYFPGTEEPRGDSIEWDDFDGGAPSAPDCAVPEAVGILFTFTDSPGWDEDVCVDIVVTDGDGNSSNRLTDLCVYVP
jgi:hypothetical protein